MIKLSTCQILVKAQLLTLLTTVMLVSCGGETDTPVDEQDTVTEQSAVIDQNVNSEQNAGTEVAVGAKPPVAAAAIETLNRTPEIVALSNGCDYVIESIAVNIGDSASFTIEVDDDDTDSLTYSVSSDDEAVLTVNIDSDGVVNIEAIELGSTTVPVTVEDSEGNQDQILLNVIVES